MDDQDFGYKEITLDNLMQGAIQEIFQNELQKIILNINDQNTDWKPVRSLTLKIVFKPNEDRKGCNVTILPSTKLAQHSAIGDMIHLVNTGTSIKAVGLNYQQSNLWSEPVAENPDNKKIIVLKKEVSNLE